MPTIPFLQEEAARLDDLDGLHNGRSGSDDQAVIARTTLAGPARAVPPAVPQVKTTSRAALPSARSTAALLRRALAVLPAGRLRAAARPLRRG
jgi:hypothetical protein